MEINILQGLHSIIDDYDVFLLDVWGVLHNGVEPFPGTINALEQLQEAGKTVCLLSNSPDRARVLTKKLQTYFGIPAGHYNLILSSGEAAYHTLKGSTAKYRIVSRTDFEFQTITDLNPHTVNHYDQADFILNAYHADTAFPAAVQEELKKAAEENIPMICINPDKVVNVGAHTTLCPGALAEMYEGWGGRVTYYGKPHVPFYEQAWELTGCPDKARMIAVGDSLHTDIQGANSFGIDSLFNLSGIHRDEVLCDQYRDIHPEKLAALIDDQPHKPTAVLNGFAW